VFAVVLGLSAGAHAKGAAAPAKSAAVAKEAPTVAGLGSFNDGYRFGMNRAELTRTVVGNGGLIDKDFDPQLRKAAPGVQQRSLEAERDAVKVAFGQSTMDFGSTPVGLDSGALGKEYTYGNRETAMLMRANGKKRYYFFINDKLWKVYDEVVLGGAAAMGATFNEIDAKLSTKFATQPRRSTQDGYPQIDWQDQTTHLRVIDRTSENIVGMVIEDRATLSQLASLRTHAPPDLFAVDPSIAAVTKGGLSDPNKQQAQQPEPEVKPKKKGKK
jgi:hypothetical protein